MPLGQLPYVIFPSDGLQQKLGRRLPHAAEAALRSLLTRRRTLEVAHLQVEYAGIPIAFSSSIGSRGDIVLRMEEGDPRLALREVGEDQLRDDEIDAQARRRAEPRSRRRHS